MRRVLVALALSAACSLAQQTSSSADSGIPAELQVKRATSAKDSAETEDQKASGQTWHLRLGTIWVGAGYSKFSWPFYYPYSFYPFPGFYSPPLWDPYSSYFYPIGYFSYDNGKGEVRLSAPRQADVYLDNAYAGKAEKLKSIWLEPGAYDLSVSDSDHASYHQRIYVLSGKSLKIATKLQLRTNLPKTEEKP